MIRKSVFVWVEFSLLFLQVKLRPPPLPEFVKNGPVFGNPEFERRLEDARRRTARKNMEDQRVIMRNNKQYADDEKNRQLREEEDMLHRSVET